MNALYFEYRTELTMKIYRGHEHGKPRTRYRFHRDRR
jgi:hypothetical protein